MLLFDHTSPIDQISSLLGVWGLSLVALAALDGDWGGKDVGCSCLLCAPTSASTSRSFSATSPADKGGNITSVQ